MSTDTVDDYGMLDTRYAIYFAPPPGHPLKQFADAWLGRDPDADERVAQPVVHTIPPERLHEITALPRHYGFHATLKAPFVPVPGLEADALLGDIEAFASRHRPLEVRLKVAPLGDFLALVPVTDVPALDRLAADCVRDFDRFRAPLSPEERARRKPDHLSEVEQANLERWGYPYVLDQFRFHLTLTGPLDEPERGRVQAILEGALASHLAQPMRIDQLALFTQTHRVAPFRIVGRFHFHT